MTRMLSGSDAVSFEYLPISFKVNLTFYYKKYRYTLTGLKINLFFIRCFIYQVPKFDFFPPVVDRLLPQPENTCNVSTPH